MKVTTDEIRRMTWPCLIHSRTGNVNSDLGLELKEYERNELQKPATHRKDANILNGLLPCHSHECVHSSADAQHQRTEPENIERRSSRRRIQVNGTLYGRGCCKSGVIHYFFHTCFLTCDPSKECCNRCSILQDRISTILNVLDAWNPCMRKKQRDFVTGFVSRRHFTYRLSQIALQLPSPSGDAWWTFAGEKWRSFLAQWNLLVHLLITERFRQWNIALMKGTHGSRTSHSSRPIKW